jgi:colanic acid biosynthesis glycosyl transferase WcaI
MRILIYGINFAPELTGIGKYTGEMAAFLAEKGHDIRVITAPPYYPQWQKMPGYSYRWYKKERWQGISVYRCPLWLPGRSKKSGGISGPKRILHLASFALSSLPAALAQVSWRPERVVVLAPSVFNAPAAALVAKLAKAKAWLHIQDFELDAALGMNMLPKAGFFRRLGFKVERWLYRSFDRVSTISNRMLDRLLAKGVDPEKVALFPNWVDPRQIFPFSGYNVLHQALKVSDQDHVILYSGNMGQKQGLEVLVEAAMRLKNESRIIFVLSGEGAIKEQLEEMARGLENVRFISLQPLERLNALLNLATIHVLPQAACAADLVMPSKLSGMLASGRPVIVTAAEGTELAEVVRPLGKVIPPGRADCLAEAILELEARPDLRAELGERGRAFAEQTWAKEVVLEKFSQSLLSL